MKKILLIEDDPTTRDLLATALELEGFKAIQAANGRAGIWEAQQTMPDLILCDVTMPEVDGYAVLAAIRMDAVLADVPFIFLTARGERADLRLGMNSGADDYLTKPIAIQDMLAAIHARLARQMKRTPLCPKFDSGCCLESLGLTPKEAETLLWVAQGKSNRDVACILSVTEGTVKKHLEHIFEKLGVESRGAATLLALEALSRG
jgi:DNA-binding NarL/FixJ family response regulator